MAKAQTELALPPPLEVVGESEQEAEARWHAQLLRRMEDAADEVGRSFICYALNLSEGTLSKKLRGVDEKVADARLLAFLLKHEKTGRLARFLAEYAGFRPFEREEKIDADTALTQIVALALAGETGNAAKEKILAVYQRVKKASAR